jgi:hypothetical protein
MTLHNDPLTFVVIRHMPCPLSGKKEGSHDMPSQ